jgi:hypothetical protein
MIDKVWANLSETVLSGMKSVHVLFYWAACCTITARAARGSGPTRTRGIA